MTDAPRDQNQVTAALAVDDTTGEVRPWLTDADGNLLIAATISDVTVAEGGTGLTSLTPYAVLTGGTTSTSPMQQVSGVGTAGQVLTSNGAGALPSWQSTGGAGTVTSVSVVTANGVSGSVATATTTPAITLTLGAITPSSVNGNTITVSSGTLTLGAGKVLTANSTLTLAGTDGKTLTVNKSITLDGTDATTMTFPTTSATIARTDAGNTFTGSSTASAWVLTSPTITTGIVPTSNDGAALGSTTNQFSDLFLAEGGVINWDNGDATITQTGNDITIAGITTFGVGTSTAVTLGTIEVGAASDTTISRSSAGVIAVEGVVIPSISSTNTLTNKRVTRRLTTTNAPGATPTINTDNLDIANLTGLNTAITSLTTNLSGTPVDGDLLEIRFTDDGTARAITFGASFVATTVALPTTTVISTMLRALFEWNGSAWACVATA